MDLLFDDFDFAFQPAVNKQQILDLATLRFIENNYFFNFLYKNILQFTIVF